MAVTESYKALLVETHAANKWGSSGKSWAERVFYRIGPMKARDLLDFGCGRGTFKVAMARYTNTPVNEYDPGVPGKDGKPGAADIVVSTDVLEHIEPDQLDETLKQLRKLTRKELFLVISCRPANQILPDGRNAHLIIKKPEWWLKKLEQALPGWAAIIHEPIYDKSKRLVISFINPKAK